MVKARIRGGASEMEVDRGRGRRGVEYRERKDRVCRECRGGVKDLEHAAFKCARWDTLRGKWKCEREEKS